MADRRSLEPILIERGFLPLDKLITNNSIEYLLINTSYGQYALVLLDVENYHLSIQPTDRILSPGNDSSLDALCKSNFFDQIDLDVAGIAFLRRDHICTMRRDPETCRVLECTFYPSNQVPVSYVEMEIPIVYLRDILENPGGTLASIYSTTVRLRHLQMRQLLDRYTVLNQYLNEIFTLLPTIWATKSQVDTLLSDAVSREETRNPAIPANLRIMNDRMFEYKIILRRLNAALEMTDLPGSAMELRTISTELTQIRNVLLSEN